MHLSYSKVSTFSACGFRYKLRYLYQVPAKPRSYLRFGTVLHSVLERFYLYGEEGRPSLEYLLSLYAEAWSVPNEGQRRYYERGLEILKRYYARNIESWQPPLWVEYVFKAPVGQHILTGVFDRVDHLEDGKYEVMDYKAQKAVPTQEQMDNDLQLALYALAFQKLAGVIPHLSVYHLRENRKLTTVRSEHQLRQAQLQVLEVARRICEGRFHPEENAGCRWCDYRAYCPLKAEEPLPIPEERLREGAFQIELPLEVRQRPEMDSVGSGAPVTQKRARFLRRTSH